jgi:biopolymer transport protein ExbD
MRRFPATTRKKSRIELIPMIDVMMFLLVFFVLLSINVIPALGLKMKLPTSNQAVESHPPIRVILSVPAKGNYLLDGQDHGDLTQLGQVLRQRKSEAKPGIAVIIQGDEDAALQRLVDAMDMLKGQGIDAMTIAAKRK